MYTDEMVKQLPAIVKIHPHYAEWLIRKRSSKKLLQYIRKRYSAANILEIGCGNGWLSAQMAEATTGNVTGLDLNHVEIAQAKRVFANINNCRFIAGNVDPDVLGDGKFDLIIFAASIQYFKSLKDTLRLSLKHLTLQGEIHIIDSMLYEYMKIPAAQERSKKYFSSMGFPEMAHHYFHHCITSLGSFEREILHDPRAWWNKFTYPANPFYWVVIKKRYYR